MQLQRVVTTFADAMQAKTVLSKLARLGAANKMHVQVVRVIEEDSSLYQTAQAAGTHPLNVLKRQAEEARVAEALTPFHGQFAELELKVIANQPVHEALLGCVLSFAAELVVMPVESHSLLAELTRTPQEWQVLRESPVPVLMVTPRPWKERPNLFAALDILNREQTHLNTKVANTAVALAHMLKTELHLFSAFPTTMAWSADVGAAYDVVKLRQLMEKDVIAAQRALLESIKAQGYCHGVEAAPGVGIDAFAKQIDADLVVMGTVGRSGMAGWFIGNTCESVLHRAACDVWVERETKS